MSAGGQFMLRVSRSQTTVTTGLPMIGKNQGLPLDDANLANKAAPIGYTELELYLNSLVPDEVMN